MKNSKSPKEEIKKRIENKYPRPSALNKAIGTSHYKSSSEIKTKHTVNLNSTTKYDTFNYKVVFLVIVIILLIQVVLKFDKLIYPKDNKSELYLFGIQIIIASLVYFVAFIKKFEKHAITINEEGIHFSEYIYGSYGLRYKRRLVKWNDILEYGILTIPDKYRYRHNIIIGTTSMEILKVDITSMEIPPEDYISLINKHIIKRSCK